MAEFVDPHNVVARKCAFSALPKAWNESEFKKKKNQKNSEKN